MRIFADADRFVHTLLRDGKLLSCSLDDERGRDRERQWNYQDKFGAFAFGGLERNGSSYRAQAGDDNVHPHAASRNVRNCLRGGETRHEYKAINLVVAQTRNRFGTTEAALDCLFTDAIHVQAPPIVGDLDVDLAGLVIGGKRYFSGFGLAGGNALLRRILMP